MTFYEFLNITWFSQNHHLQLCIENKYGKIYNVFEPNEDLKVDDKFTGCDFEYSKNFNKVTFHEIQQFLEAQVKHVYQYSITKYSEKLDPSLIIVEIVLHIDNYRNNYV